MMQQQVLGVAGVDQLAVVAGQRFDALVGGLDENIRLVAGAAQHPLDPENFVADRVSVAERGENLVDPPQARLPTGPFGRPASTASAGGRFCRRRSNHPGSGSADRGAGSFLSRSNISRYLRSITGQS